MKNESSFGSIDPLVSICCITYNHEKYISECLEGLLKQKSNFPLEIIIHDDASKDNTKQIVQEYINLHPTLINPIFQTENQYSKGKKPLIDFVFPRAKGKYIALCEGDDYWTDPLKLQKQVDFLETNPDYVMCYHDATIVDEKGLIIKASKLRDNLKRDFSCEELIQGKMILTLTLCFRNVIKDFPDELFQSFNGDKFLTSLLGGFGKGKYMADIKKAMYRQHSGAIWSKLDKITQVYNNGVTRVWLHRYYQRMGQDKYADYFKKDIIKHFANVLKKITSSNDHQHEDIIRDIFTNYTDIIRGESEKQLSELLNLARHTFNIGTDENETTIQNTVQNIADLILPKKHPDSEHLIRSYNNPNNTSFEYWLNKKGWQYKKGLYADCFESITFQKKVNEPDISVIVISWRLHPDNLKNFQILEKQRKQNFELIFVNNGGQESEFEILKPFVDTYVRLNTNTGAYLARNIGSVFARAPILIFLEDDGLPERDFVRAHLKVYEKYDVIAARGVYSPKTDTPINKLAHHYYMGDVPYPLPSNLEGNCSYRADCFFKVGGWDDEIMFGHGGRELSLRLLGVEPDQRKQIYSPDPVIYHDFAANEGHLVEKQKKQEASLHRLKKKYPQWDNITNSWLKYTKRYDLLILKNPPYDIKKIEHLISEGKHPEAISYLKTILAAQPRNAAIYNLMGSIQLKSGQNELALKSFLKAVKLESQNPSYQKNLASLYTNLNKVKEAFDLYKSIITVYPEDIDSLMAFADLNYSMRQFDIAKQLWVSVLSLDPENTTAKQRLKRNGKNHNPNRVKASGARLRSSIIGIGEELLFNTLSSYEGGNTDEADKLLLNFIQQIKESTQ